MIKTKIKYILTFAAVMVFSGCGLYSYPYIEAPNVRTASTSNPVCVIENASGNDPDVFRGYEIYYKFYKKDSAYYDHIADHNAIFSKEEPDYTALLANGYKRCMAVRNVKKDTTVPMIPIPAGSRDTDFDITINFKTLTKGWTYERNPDTGEIIELSAKFPGGGYVPLYRCIQDTKPEFYEASSDINIYKDFNSADLEYEECNDQDLPSKEVSVSMYILSYGIYDNVHNLYSKPVWLGYVDCWK